MIEKPGSLFVNSYAWLLELFFSFSTKKEEDRLLKELLSDISSFLHNLLKLPICIFCSDFVSARPSNISLFRVLVLVPKKEFRLSDIELTRDGIALSALENVPLIFGTTF